METPIIKNIVPQDWDKQIRKISGDLVKLAEQAEAIVVKIDPTSLKAAQTVMDKYAATVGKMVEAQTQMEASYKKAQAAIDALNKSEEVANSTKAEKIRLDKEAIKVAGQLNGLVSEEGQVVEQLKYNKKELNRISALRIQLNNAESGSEQALMAQFALNKLELSKYSQETINASERLRILQGDTAKLGVQLLSLKNATGSSSKSLTSVASASNNAYFQTFQLTQVMRELPNFAIDARIGFMSISNNLPMLAEGFKNLARSTVEVTDAMGNVTTKTLGNVGALKVFAKSLLSLNTIMIAFSTVMMLLNNSKFTEWLDKVISKTSDAERVHKNYLKTLKDGSSELKSTIESTTKVESALNLYNKGLITGKVFLSEFNKELGDTYGKQTDVNAAITKFTELTPQYIEAMALQAEANKALDDSVTKSMEARSLRENKSVNFFQKQAEGAKELFMLTKDLFGFSTKQDKEYIERQESATSEVLRSRREKAAKADEQSEKSRKRFNELQEAARRILKEYGLLKEEDAKTTEKQSKSDKERYEKEVFYSANRARLEQSLYDLEQRLSKTTKDGTLNDYNERDAAARSYYYAKLELLDIDRQAEIKKAEEELASDKAKNKDLTAAQQNYENAVLLATDEFNTKQLDLAGELSTNLLAIDSDRYADEVYLMKVSHEEKLRLLEEYQQAEKSKREKMTTGEIIASSFGVDKDSAFETLQLENEVSQRKLNDNKRLIEKKLSAVQKGSEDEKQLIRELAEAEKAIEDEKRQYQLDSLDLIREKTNEAYKDMAASIKSAISGIMDAYVEMGEKQTEKESERLDKEKEDKLGRLDETQLTEEAYKAEEARINKEYDNKQKALEEEQKKREQAAFLFEQGLALATVWIKLGVANAQALTYPFPLSTTLIGLNTATAVAQTALIAAQTIPSFAEGGVMEKDGDALVGDNALFGGRKRKELLLYPDGGIGLTPDTPTLMHLKKGTTVYPDAEKLPSLQDIERKMIINNIFKSDKMEEYLGILVDETRKKPRMIDYAKQRRLDRQ